LRRNRDKPKEREAEQKLQTAKDKAHNLVEQGNNASYVERAPRYVAHWRIAIVYEADGKNEIFHGRTYEVSLSGASILSDHNILVHSSVTVLLELPWYKGKQKKKIIEIKSRMVYTIFSSENGQFRTGLQFLSFKKGEEHYIETALKDRRRIENGDSYQGM
jgi:hypothetical protein